MDRVYQSNAIETPPSSVASSGSYPTAGNKASGQLATVPGPYWFYSITEEIRNAIVSAGVTPDPAKVNQLAAAMAKFLPLSGGKVSGTITSGNNGSLAREGTSNYLGLFGSGTDWWNNGANLCLYGKDHSSNGSFAIVTCGLVNGALNKITLTGKATGDLVWAGKNIVRSVNGTSADASGNVTISVPATPKAYVTETSNGSTSWYRKWSDGFIEQGGYVTHSGSTTKTVTFPKAFSKAPLTVLGHIEGDSTRNNAYQEFPHTVTATSFKQYIWESFPIRWYACGY